MACPAKHGRDKRLRAHLPRYLEQVRISGALSVDVCQQRLDKSFHKVAQWDPSINDSAVQSHGSIFNFAFSPTGNVLLCACENHDVLLFEPNSHKKIGEIECAHNDCVNCVRFLDSRTFASCSDDKTIALWDLRKLDAPVNVLKGHSSWVKSIEYDQNSRKLVSSAFDDTVRIWDINSYSSDGKIKGKTALKLSSLVRTKLSADGTKLFLTTSSGCGIIVIHELDIDRLAKDCSRLEFFTENAKPGNYKNRAVNRVEIISEFPGENNPDCISSIDVHPYGWCILTRYAEIDGRSESTAVHDIQNSHPGGYYFRFIIHDMWPVVLTSPCLLRRN